MKMVLASLNDQKYLRYPLVLKLNGTLARPLHLVILFFFYWKFLSDDRLLYLYDSKLNSRSDVGGLTHTKQLLNLLCTIYNKFMLCISCHFGPKKTLTLRMDHGKLLDFHTSLPVSHAILPRAVCFATPRLANHVT